MYRTRFSGQGVSLNIVRIRPLWLRSPRGCLCRTGASSPCALIYRSTRFLPTRMPLAPSRIFTFRWPSPRNGPSGSTDRISLVTSSSLSSVDSVPSRSRSLSEARG